MKSLHTTITTDAPHAAQRIPNPDIKALDMTITATMANTDFKIAAKRMAKIARADATIPILRHCRVTVKRRTINFTATDLDSVLSMTFDATSTSPGSFMVLASALDGVNSTSASGPVEVSELYDDDGETSRSVILCDAFVFGAGNGAVADYPNPLWEDELCDREPITISQADLHRIFSLSRHCISNEETRYYLNGAFLTQNPDTETLRCVSTDGNRLACIDTETKIDGELSAIVPTPAVKQILKLVSAVSRAPVLIRHSGKRIEFTFGNVVYKTKLVDGTYPDYTRVIPQGTPTLSATLSLPFLQPLHAHAKSLELVPVALTIDADKGLMSVRKLGEQMTAPCRTKFRGNGPRRFAFNCKHLAAQANCTPTFKISAESPDDPATIRGDDPLAMWVLMPMRV